MFAPRAGKWRGNSQTAATSPTSEGSGANERPFRRMHPIPQQAPIFGYCELYPLFLALSSWHFAFLQPLSVWLWVNSVWTPHCWLHPLQLYAQVLPFWPIAPFKRNFGSWIVPSTMLIQQSHHIDYFKKHQLVWNEGAIRIISLLAVQFQRHLGIGSYAVLEAITPALVFLWKFVSNKSCRY